MKIIKWGIRRLAAIVVVIGESKLVLRLTLTTITIANNR